MTGWLPNRLMHMHAAKYFQMLAAAPNGLSLSEREHTEGPAQRKHKLERERRSRRCQPQQHSRRHQPSHKKRSPFPAAISSRGVDLFRHSPFARHVGPRWILGVARGVRARKQSAGSVARQVGRMRAWHRTADRPALTDAVSSGLLDAYRILLSVPRHRQRRRPRCRWALGGMMTRIWLSRG